VNETIEMKDEIPAEPQIFIEPWSSEYGSPMHIDEDNNASGSAELIDGEGFEFVEPSPIDAISVAFIDGVRHMESALSQYRDGRSVAGITGSYAVGAVLCRPDATPMLSSELIDRVVVWSSGMTGALRPIPDGWSWREESTADGRPGAPMRHLQEMMRRAEARLADQLAEEGYLVLLDGTLWFASTYDKRNIAGYVKTHHVRLLPEREAFRLPDLPAGQRTTLFRTDANRYALYLRLAPRGPYAPPMAGIVRLEFSGSLPLEEARAMANRFAVSLPKYAGIAHVDPRAPQNLQPIGALETHLRRLLSDPRLAERAARDSVATLTGTIGESNGT
jgi:hypothetical protein